MKKFSTADRLNQIMRTRNMRQVDILNAADPFCRKYGVPDYADLNTALFFYSCTSAMEFLQRF